MSDYHSQLLSVADQVLEELARDERSTVSELRCVREKLDHIILNTIQKGLPVAPSIQASK